MTKPTEKLSIHSGQLSDFERGYPVSRHLANHYVDSFQCHTNNGEIYYKLTDVQKSTLEDVLAHLDNESTTLTMGISSLGKLIAVAASFKPSAIDMEIISEFGWFLSDIANKQNCNSEFAAQVVEILENS